MGNVDTDLRTTAVAVKGFVEVKSGKLEAYINRPFTVVEITEIGHTSSKEDAEDKWWRGFFRIRIKWLNVPHIRDIERMVYLNHSALESLEALGKTPMESDKMIALKESRETFNNIIKDVKKPLVKGREILVKDGCYISKSSNKLVHEVKYILLPKEIEDGELDTYTHVEIP